MKKDALTRTLAVAGTIFLWLPIVATLATSLIGSIIMGRFRFDWLMPAELFLSVLLGGALLLWATMRAHARRGLVAWGIGAAILMLFGAQLLAQFTGLASGAIEPTGWEALAVTAAIAAYSAAVIELGVSGVLLVRDLFAKAHTRTPASPTT